MASAVASVGNHPALPSSIRDGSSLASDSGFCDNHVSVAVSPKVSLSVNHRNRFASVRALQQGSSAFPKSVYVPSKSQSRNNKVMAQQRGLLSSNLLQSVDVSVSHGEFLNNRTGSVRQIRVRAVTGESQAVEGEEGKGEPTSTNEKPTSSGTSTPSPFSAGKISSKIASKTSQQAENGKSSAPPATKKPLATNKAPATAKTVSKDSTNLSTSKPASASTPSVFAKAPTTKPSFAVKPKSLIDDGSDGAFPTGKVSPFAADRLKSQMSSPPSQYNRTSSGRTMINSGKQVLDAFKQGEKDGKTTKFGQPIVPKNIFDDVRQTQEEKDADKFSFNLRPGDIFLVFSFLLIIGLMLGTAFIVWKVGAIHYNE